ncbi:MAG: HDOD domain-containing protein [Planctomycetota bacterium]
MFKRDSAKALKKVLGDYELPSFPGVVLQVLERIRAEEASVASVVECIELDPGLSVRILAAVNTAAYSPRSRVENLAQAVAMLGMATVESLALAIAVGCTLPRPHCQGFEPRRFWLAAARRAAIARTLAKELHPATRSEAFTAALLQDMAVPLLAACRASEYGKVLSSWHHAEGTLPELEHDALGFDHAMVATWLCEAWQLPTSLSSAIGQHHASPGAAAACPPAVTLVATLRETDEPDGVDDLVALTEQSFGLAADDVIALVRSGFEEAEELAPLFA